MLAIHRKRHTWADKVDGYIALTEFARHKFVEGGLPAEKINVKPNFLLRDPGEKMSDGEFALFVGRLSPEKGLGILLRAWRLLHSPIPLQIIGEGPIRSELEHRAGDYSLSGVSFRGRLSRSETQSAIKSARVLILSSECYENFPMTIIEAFACGTPVICSRLGAMQEIVKDGWTGLHFTPGSAEELAERVEWAWNHPPQMRAMGKRARLEYEGKYTAVKNHTILMEVYQHAIAALA
jgi:glycosyltransferase involved in cell wall biosynthesis